MKKIAKSGIVAATSVFFALLLAFNVGAEGSPLLLTVETVDAAVGETVEVSVIVSENETGFFGPFLSFTYDSSLSLTNVKNGEYEDFTFSYGGDLTANPFKVLFDTLDPQYYTGVLFTASFKVPEDAQPGTTYDISITECDVCDADFYPITPELISGKIMVNAYGGACGDNAQWRLYEDGRLVISGSGTMQDFADTASQPWADHRTEIKAITVESGITSIGENTFADFENLTSVTIPASVSEIGLTVFDNCKKITNFVVAPENPNFSSEKSGILFNKDKTTLIKYYSCNASSEYAVPYTVTAIGEKAFSGCTALSEITIHKNAASIGQNAFSGCEALTVVCFENSAAHTYAVDNNISFELITAIESEASEDDIYVMGAQLRLDEKDFKTDMRFVTRIRKDFLTANGISEFSGENVQFGSLVLPYEQGYMLYGDKLSISDKTSEGWSASRVPAVNMFKEDETYVYFTVCLTDISRYERYYAVRPYVILADSVYIYGAQYQTANLHDVCVLAAEDFLSREGAIPAAITNIFYKCGREESMGRFNDNEVSLPW